MVCGPRDQSVHGGPATSGGQGAHRCLPEWCSRVHELIAVWLRERGGVGESTLVLTGWQKAVEPAGWASKRSGDYSLVCRCSGAWLIAITTQVQRGQLHSPHCK
jgi:hypothetical protein